ncbi:MAG: alpha/beta fold hydrolase [Acidimicrobiales bacterium]
MLIGHSLGGIVVTAAAPFVEAVAVVNVDQPLALGDMVATVKSLADDLRSPERFHATLAALFSALASPGLDPEIQAALDLRVAGAEQDVVLGVWGPMIDGTTDDVAAQVDAVLAGVTMPYLALHGIDPGPDYGDWLRNRVPRAEYEFHDGEGHFLHLVDPGAFVSRVQRFLVQSGS